MQQMSDDYRIRPFVPDDLPALHEIREASFAPVFQSFRSIVGEKIASVAFASAEAEQGELLDKICAAGSGHKVFVAESGRRPVGFCTVSFDHASTVGEIDLTAVHPGHQGRGVGAMMFDYAFDLMREAGMTVATVSTGGDPSHAPARRAYEKAGFSVGLPSVYYYRTL
ncbi:MAG: GNAT family N-acetyltransferase [Hyphococcus sp.]